MKVEKLFKKIEKFFLVQEKEQKKKDKLRGAIEDKILSLKMKIKATKSNEKKEQLKKELSVLKEFRDKIK